MKIIQVRKIYLFLLGLFPRLRSVLVQWIYNSYATKNNSEKNIFLNYGYDDDTPLHLDPHDESNRYFIQLYHRAVQDIDIQDKDIVEVGCGQGAGGMYLLQHKNPRSYIGVDLSEKAIELCQRNNKFKNAQWMQGRADRLLIPDKSVDVVINVESSHLYPSMDQFIKEVLRILKPNGYMAFADLRRSSQVDALDKLFSSSGLLLLHRADISLQVLNSLSRISDRRKAHINATYHRIWRQAAREVSGVKGSDIYNGFINGQQKYLCYLLQKKGIK